MGLAKTAAAGEATQLINERFESYTSGIGSNMFLPTNAIGYATQFLEIMNSIFGPGGIVHAALKRDGTVGMSLAAAATHRVDLLQQLQYTQQDGMAVALHFVMAMKGHVMDVIRQAYKDKLESDNREVQSSIPELLKQRTATAASQGGIGR